METSPVFSKSNHHDVVKTTIPIKGGWKSAIFIIFVEIGERFAYYGVSGNLIIYLLRVLKQPLATAAKNVNLWHGVSAIFPLVGGFMADSYFGRFKIIVFSSVTYLLGLVLLVISAEAIPLNHRLLPFFVALYIINIGEGGHRPCIQTFAADQFDEVDQAAKSSFFNWWYLGIVMGACSAILVVVYIQDHNGWGWGYAIPTIVVAIALGVFLFGTSTYRKEVPVGSPFTKVAQVIVAAYKKRNMSLKNDCHGMHLDAGENGLTMLARTNQFRFLDKAAMIDEIDISSEKTDNWRLCTVNQVEQVKLLFRLIPISLSCLGFTIVIAQLGTFYTKQATTLNRQFGSTNFKFPPAYFQVIPGITILIAVPLYERLLIPTAKRFTGHPSGITMLQRIGFGIFLSILTMIVSALVESKRVKVATHYGLIDKPEIVLPMSVWWLVPQYVLMGISDVFTIVGLQELFYDQVPEEMRSMGAAANSSVVGIGSFMSTALISLVEVVSAQHGDEWFKGDNLNRAHLDYFYWLLACLSGFSLVLYVGLAKGFVYKKLQINSEV
ncbi:protein NRT1/ PTR FAMILY 5.4 [Rutidosis leptorrhynchoides]|uniref:protein NRT1/ PTR FAMILY 5.4 n=1 Tax=Rutidosis leptorrhynchoides TaxID=125765 RepID=UPI003A99C7EB